MSGVFGSGKSSDPQDVNVPAFTSQGGITPEQQTLSNFSLGQGLDAQGALFGGSGTGASTMATQGAAGAQNTVAQQAGVMSDTDQEAQYTDYENQVNALQQSLQNNITESNEDSASLSGLASAAGSLFGSGTKSSFGGSS